MKSFTPLILALILGGCLPMMAQKTAPQPKKKTYDPVKVLMTWEGRANRTIEKVPTPKSPLTILENGTVMTATGTTYKPGHVVFENGRILAVGQGPAPKAQYPKAKRVNLKGAFVTPGIIDTHSHLGVYPAPHAKAHSDGNEMTHPVTPGVWAEHGFWPQDPGIEWAVSGGVTTIMALPGSANLVGGRGVTLHMVKTRGARAMRFPGAPIGVKMACGENPKRVYGKKHRSPATRMGNVRGHREVFAKARAYIERIKRLGPKTPRDMNLETLAGVLLGKFLPQVHCYRADDILAFLQVADEFGFKVRGFHHGLEAYKVRDILAKKNISVSTWADWWGYKLEMYDGIPENAAFLHESGGIAVIHSDSSRDIGRLNQETAKAYQAGLRAGVKLTPEDALKWITINAAWTLGIEKEVGSLERGKRADIVIWNKNPLSVYAHAQVVFVDGAVRYKRGKRGKPWSDFSLGQEVGR